ncbi:hypothetical protein DFJ77DRAFT_6369 [Powellomyces hirtus]|nr:hypothetical protein DFJ77DRAFT_6369 [Powellomyces hirtus]
MSSSNPESGLTRTAETTSPQGKNGANDLGKTMPDINFRVPYMVPLIGITVIIAAVTSGIIGSLSFQGADKTVDKITATLANDAMGRAYDSAYSMISTVPKHAQLLGSNVVIREALDDIAIRGVEPHFLRDYPAAVSIAWQATKAQTQLGLSGFVTTEGGQAAMFLASPGVNIAIMQDAMTGNFGQLNMITETANGALNVPTNISNPGVFYDYHFKNQVNTTRPTATSSTVAPYWGAVRESENSINYGLEMHLWQGQPFGSAVVGVPEYASIAVSLSIQTIETLLQAIDISPNTVIGIWEADGKMVACNVPHVVRPVGVVERSFAHSTSSTLLSETARRLRSSIDDYASLGDSQIMFRDSTGGAGDIVVTTRWLRDAYGLEWLLVVAFPRDDFTAVLQSTRKTVIGAVAGTAVAMAVGSIFLAFGLVYPIRRLSQTMIQATSFDFSSIRDGYLTHSSIFEPAEIAQCKSVFSIMLKRFASAIEANKSLVGGSGRSAPGRESVVKQPNKQRKESATKAVAERLDEESPV